MLQLGLRLLSVSGLSITATRQFLLKCSACFAISRDMTRRFCASCGLPALIRCTLALRTEPETGVVTARLYHGTRHLSKRGTVYSIPRPRGGRGGGGLKLAEDVMDGFGRRRRERRAGAGGREKGREDAESLYEKGLEFGLSQTGRVRKQAVVGYGRRNPNEVAKRTGNRKRRS
jgi:RNA-binding protein NOB1